MLTERGFPHKGKLFKVFAQASDPSETIGRKISTIESSGEPFLSEIRFDNTIPWQVEDLELFFADDQIINQEVEKARALFRFANRPDLGIAQLAMYAKNEEGKPRYNHPLAIVHGYEKTMRGRSGALHLDIFMPQSVERLGKIIDLEKKDVLVDRRELDLLSFDPENSNPQKERS